MHIETANLPNLVRPGRKVICWAFAEGKLLSTLFKLLLLALSVLLSACASDSRKFDVEGEINGHEIATTVDAFEAKYYLESYLSKSLEETGREIALDDELRKLPEVPIDRDEYEALATRYSTDFATLHLIKQLSDIPENRRLQVAYWREVNSLRALSARNGADLQSCALSMPAPLFLFAPGWLYKTNPATGSDFAEQRRLLKSIGLETQLIATQENASVEANARLIAAKLRSVGGLTGPIVIISASKAGPEVAHAIGHLLSVQESSAVKAWINVGGLLKGSPLADWSKAWPNDMLVSLFFASKGLDIRESLSSMTTSRSVDRWRRETIPEHIRLFNFVAAPLSGHVTQEARFGYSRIGKAGPSDGLTSIIDELAHGGTTVLEVGLDHYYRDPEIHLKTVALALVVVREVFGPVDVDCLPPAMKASDAQSYLNFL